MEMQHEDYEEEDLLEEQEELDHAIARKRCQKETTGEAQKPASHILNDFNQMTA